MLEFDNVSGIMEKKGKFALKNICFKLPDGYIMGLAGPNGAGKTTLLNYIVNSQKMYEGRILIDGCEIHDDYRKIMNGIGFVSEDRKFFSEYTLSKNADILGMFYTNWNKQIFETKLLEMKVDKNQIAGLLSRGEMMKFQMAFAMAYNPSLYIIDEATAGMDPVFRIEFFKILRNLTADEKTSIIMTTHIESELERNVDYRGILIEGRMSEYGEIC